MEDVERKSQKDSNWNEETQGKEKTHVYKQSMKKKNK
jgi:hypothetical protein